MCIIASYAVINRSRHLTRGVFEACDGVFLASNFDNVTPKTVDISFIQMWSDARTFTCTHITVAIKIIIAEKETCSKTERATHAALCSSHDQNAGKPGKEAINRCRTEEDGHDTIHNLEENCRFILHVAVYWLVQAVLVRRPGRRKVSNLRIDTVPQKCVNQQHILS
jgi:hypothetical protein